MRLVSLACSNTEIVCKLGCEQLLVGVDDHSDYPVGVVDALPRVGPDLQIDVEAVAALEPDLVLASDTVPGHEHVIAALEAKGLPYLVLAPQSLEDVFADIREIGQAIDAEAAADQLTQRMAQTITAHDDSAPGEASGNAPSILIQWWPKPVISPGAQSWATDLIHAAGGHNPIGSEPIKSRPLPDEEIAALNPAAIVISWCGVSPDKYRPEVVLGNESWGAVEAVSKGHVFCVPEAFLGRPGPRLVDGFAALRGIVRSLGPAAVPHSR